MAQLVTNFQTNLPGEEVIVRSVPFFTNEKWRPQTQSARNATFAGRPYIPWGLIILTIFGFFFFLFPGIILYFFVIKRMYGLQNIVVTANPITGGTEVVITYPKPAKKMVDQFINLLPPASL